MRTAKPPLLSPRISPAPSSSSSYFKISEPLSHPTSHLPVDFSPPLIAMVAVLAAAFLLVTYSRLISRRFISPMLRRFRRWRHRRRRLLHLSSSATSSSSSDHRSLSPFPFDSFHYSSYSPYGLDDSVIKTLPLFLYSATACSGRTAAAVERRDCAVCLLEFEDGDYVRTLPSCSHAFHVECIDEWLRSHPNCPLCRATILGSSVPAITVAPPSPFIPLMASRIRPSLDDEANTIIIGSIDEPPPRHIGNTAAAAEADQEIAPSAEDQSPVTTPLPTRYFELKRSYSFGSASETITTEQVTVSPWRYRRSAGTFWSKRASPFGNLISKPRVFSFRCYRCTKSPFFRRRSGGFFPAAGSSTRWIKSMTSPRLFRNGEYLSSRLRCGDPEALLSPERWRSRR